MQATTLICMKTTKVSVNASEMSQYCFIVANKLHKLIPHPHPSLGLVFLSCSHVRLSFFLSSDVSSLAAS